MSGGPDTLVETAGLLRHGAVTSAALVEECLARSDAAGKELGIYVTRCDDEARRAARRADECLAAGIDLGPLHGIPVAVKDNLLTVDTDTTAQSAACRLGEDGRRDAEVVRRLRAGGAVIVGKTSLMEFATALPGEDDAFPVPRNPWDASRWAGGSSSGSAAGVAAGLFAAGIGTDTGGSIRNPAAFCGVAGLKPSYGLVPTAGMIPLAPSLDCIGPIARTSRDCGLILTALAGAAAPSSPEPPRRLGGLRIGIDRCRMVDIAGAAAGVARRFDAALGWFADHGADIVDVDVPLFEELTFIMRLTIDSERLALHRPNLDTRGADYSASFRDKVRRAVFFSAADYVRAQWIRDEGRRRLDRLWERVDVVASPTAHYTAPPVATLARDNRSHLQMTAVWSSLGTPALSVPMGPADDGLPVGLQLAGPWGSDGDLLRIGDAFQDGTDWHLARCPYAAAVAGGTA